MRAGIKPVDTRGSLNTVPFAFAGAVPGPPLGIGSPYCSKALAVCVRLGRLSTAATASVGTESMDTTPVVAGFGDGHYVGRPPHRDAGRFQMPADRLAVYTRHRLSPPQRPPQSDQRDHLSSFGLVEDIAHGGKRICRNAPPDYASSRLRWPVFRYPLMAGFGCPPRLRRRCVFSCLLVSMCCARFTGAAHRQARTEKLQGWGLPRR